MYVGKVFTACVLFVKSLADILCNINILASCIPLQHDMMRLLLMHTSKYDSTSIIYKYTKLTHMESIVLKSLFSAVVAICMQYLVVILMAIAPTVQ